MMENMKIIATLDEIKEVSFISIPKKNNKGYLKAPVSFFKNDLTILIEDLGFIIDEHYPYIIAVRCANKLFNEESINYLLTQISKKYNKEYEIKEWDDFWDFIDSLSNSTIRL